MNLLVVLLSLLQKKMVTMNSSEKAQRACQQGPSRENSKCVKEDKEKDKDKEKKEVPCGVTALMATIASPEESPNYLIYKRFLSCLRALFQMEALVEKMQDETTGVPVRTVKSFMSKIPSVFTGSDLVAWLARHLPCEEPWEAAHLAHLLAAHGYLFPIDDHALTVRNDGTYYRFQTPYFWPSNQWEPENTDYAVYLCKRTMQNKARLELADYEAESLARLQKMFSRKWEFIFMQAEAQSKVDKKRDKLERKVLDSQERAFWDVHRPMPGCVNTTELDPKKLSRISALKERRLRHCQEMILQQNVKNNPIVTVTNPQESEEDIQRNAEVIVGERAVVAAAGAGGPGAAGDSTAAVAAARRQVAMLRARLERRSVKVSKVQEMFIAYCNQYAEYDPFLSPPEWPNPWTSDSTEMWDLERHWFWTAVQELKALPISGVAGRARDIWRDFLASDAVSPVNIDAHTRELTRARVEAGADRYCFDQAQAHVYHLMKSDSYSRYLRSDMYKDILNGSKKKTSVKGIRSIVSFSARKDAAN